MNIFEEYINKITALILKNQKFLKLKNLNEFKGIVVESPPEQFNYDLSCNAGLVLGKMNKIDPIVAVEIKRNQGLLYRDLYDNSKGGEYRKVYWENLVKDGSYFEDFPIKQNKKSPIAKPQVTVTMSH